MVFPRRIVVFAMIALGSSTLSATEEKTMVSQEDIWVEKNEAGQERLDTTKTSPGGKNTWKIRKKDDKEYFVIINGKEFGPYDAIPCSPVFSEDDSQWTFGFMKKHCRRFSPGLFRPFPYFGIPPFDPHLFLYFDGYFVNQNDHIFGPYDGGLSQAKFSPGGLTFHFGNKNRDYIFLNGYVYDEKNTFFSSDFLLFAERYVKSGKTFIKFQGRVYGPYDQLGRVVLPDGGLKSVWPNPSGNSEPRFCFDYYVGPQRPEDDIQRAYIWSGGQILGPFYVVGNMVLSTDSSHNCFIVKEMPTSRVQTYVARRAPGSPNRLTVEKTSGDLYSIYIDGKRVKRDWRGDGQGAYWSPNGMFFAWNVESQKYEALPFP
jgi:hypothetical protein